MGYINHHAIVVTSSEYALISAAHADAEGRFGPLTSPLLLSPFNRYLSFFIAPDGSKEGWPESDAGDAKRTAFLDYLDTLAYEDGSNSVQFVEIAYDDDYQNRVTRTNRRTGEAFEESEEAP